MNRSKKIVIGIVIVLAIVAIGCVVAVAFLAIKNTPVTLDNILAQLQNRSILIVWIAGVVIIATVIAVKYSYSSARQRNVMDSNSLENNYWLEKSEMRKLKDITLCKYDELSEKPDGIVINARKCLGGIDIAMSKPAHTLVIGTTGSGKTSAFVSPNIQIMAKTKTKPSMIISDIKGELYRQHTELLKQEGYTIKVLDLGDRIYESARWNPFQQVIKLLDESKAITIQDVISDKDRLRLQILQDEIFQNLQDVIYTICPIEKSQDTMWQSGARDFIFAVALGIAEDYQDGLIGADKLTLYSIYKNITMYCDDEMSEFSQFFENRRATSKVQGLANTVLVTQDRTLTSYLTDVNRYVQWIADNGVASLTSTSDIDFDEIDERPTAVFIQMSDERQNRNKIASLFVLQMYKALVAKARTNEAEGVTKEQTLLRNVYFLLDEFGNLPKINNVQNIISVGRSRKIWLIPVIQDYAQLGNKYGSELASIIKSNCNIKIFIGSTDKQTVNEISELCGKTKVTSVSYSESSRDKEGMSSSNTSFSAREKPLIYPSELESLNRTGNWGNIIALIFGHQPYRGKITPVFECNKYHLGTANDVRELNVFEQNIYYDITQRDSLRKSTLDEEEYIQDKIAQLDRNKQIESRLLVFKNKIPDSMIETMERALSESNYAELIKLICWAQDNAKTSLNSMLAFELAKLKVYVEGVAKENEYYENDKTE